MEVRTGEYTGFGAKAQGKVNTQHPDTLLRAGTNHWSNTQKVHSTNIVQTWRAGRSVVLKVQRYFLWNLSAVFTPHTHTFTPRGHSGTLTEMRIKEIQTCSWDLREIGTAPRMGKHAQKHTIYIHPETCKRMQHNTPGTHTRKLTHTQATCTSYTATSQDTHSETLICTRRHTQMYTAVNTPRDQH